MCGISGIFSSRPDVSLDAVRVMNNKIAHRGPDHDAFFLDDYLAVGHRRLAIIDLDERSNQPMVYEDLVIVFNGEIYNFKAIRALLVKEGYWFDSQGDCEVVIKAYHQWGEECVQYFKGMWSFCIFDKKKKSLFCSRDRFGIKPFYYKLVDQCFYFGSELKQLCGSDSRPKFDNIIDFIAGGYVDHNESTFFEGILQLPPSSNLRINVSGFEPQIIPYFTLDQNSAGNTLHDVKTLFEEAVDEHLIADVSLGSCLSGGLDSSFINYRVASVRPDSVAIHCNSSDEDYSERDKADCVARSLGVTLYVVEPTFSEFEEDLDELFYVQEQPFGDPSVYMQYRVMKKASSLGIKVMLDGQGADEVFMGYSKYLGMRLWNDFSFLTLGKFFKSFKAAISNSDLTTMQLTVLMLGTKYEKLKRLGLLLKCKLPLSYWSGFISRGVGGRTSEAFQASELYEYPLQTLLRNEDRNSMFFSIEARVPYLDHLLVGKLHSEGIVKCVSAGWSKFLLRDAASDHLPHEIVYRRDKLGFNSPPSWLGNLSYSEIAKSKILRTIFGKSVNENRLSRMDPKLKWRLLSVAIWERVFNVTVG